MRETDRQREQLKVARKLAIVIYRYRIIMFRETYSLQLTVILKIVVIELKTELIKKNSLWPDFPIPISITTLPVSVPTVTVLSVSAFLWWVSAETSLRQITTWTSTIRSEAFSTPATWTLKVKGMHSVLGDKSRPNNSSDCNNFYSLHKYGQITQFTFVKCPSIGESLFLKLNF